MAKIIIDGLQSSYVFILLYICWYAHKSLYHRNKINLFLNFLELTLSLNYQFASYRLVYQGHPSSYFRSWIYNILSVGYRTRTRGTPAAHLNSYMKLHETQ